MAEIVDFLNEVDYRVNSKYVPTEFALEFVNFIKLINGDQAEENKTPVLHYQMLDKLTSKSKSIANMVFRGGAKTSVLAEYLFLYVAVYGSLPGLECIEVSLYVTDSIENGVKNMRRNLEYRWQNSNFLQHYVPKTRFTDVRWEFTNRDGKTSVVNGYGAKAIPLDSILYEDGLESSIGACEVGDRIFGADGKLSVITAKSEIFHKSMYQIDLEDGRSIRVSGDHINAVVTEAGLPLELTVEGILEKGGLYIQNCDPMEYTYKKDLIFPYATGKNMENLDNMQGIFENYLRGSIKQRLSLLQGLLDKRGKITRAGNITFKSGSNVIIQGVMNLVRSLGGTCKKKLLHTGDFRIKIWINMPVFKRAYKLKKMRIFHESRFRIKIVNVLDIPNIPSQCIAIDNQEHQYLTNDYVRTHNTGVRGKKEMIVRPSLAVLDDLISDDDARSPTVISSIEDTVYKAIEYALHPTRFKILWSGTPFNCNDPLYKAIESGAWDANVFPVCENFPCSKVDFRGAWEDRFTYEAILDKYNKAVKAGKVETFNQEMMLKIISDENRLILDCDISWYNRKTVLNNIELFNFYITTDFAVSAKSSADFSVISVWAYNTHGDWLWVDGVCVKQDMSKNVNDLFRLAQKYKPQQVGVEVSGQQGGFINWLQNEMLVRNIYFSLAKENNSSTPGIRPVMDKISRFKLMIPMFKMNKIFFPTEREESPEIVEAMNELKLATPGGFKSKHDDFIDTVSMLFALTPWKPSAECPKTGDNTLWEEFEEEPLDVLDSYLV